jgi:signal transduction histidine kinase
LVEESLNLAYHGERARDSEFNIGLEHDFDPETGAADLLPQEVSRVLVNLFGNGFYATRKRKEAEDKGYDPTRKLATRNLGDAVEIRVRDNGIGMSETVREKLFTPSFTTKPTGEGTGLGLSLSYDIVTQQHKGSIGVESEEGAFTEFTIVLPRQFGGASTVTQAKE